MSTTQYQETESRIIKILAKAQEIFIKKNGDYGASFAYLRPKSMTDQLHIKIARIRHIEETGKQLVEDAIDQDMLGILNYGAMAILRMQHSEDALTVMKNDELVKNYGDTFESIKNLRVNKNHDYGEVWRLMRTSSITDQILSKVLRIKAIENNGGNHSDLSEGIIPLYQDIVNYAFFWLIHYEDSRT